MTSGLVTALKLALSSVSALGAQVPIVCEWSELCGTGRLVEKQLLLAGWSLLSVGSEDVQLTLSENLCWDHQPVSQE